MATFDLGRVTPLYKGDYSASASYELNDVVLYNGNLYWHVQATATVGILPTDTTVWKLAFADEGIRAEIRGYADNAQNSADSALSSKAAAASSASSASASASQAALSAQTAQTAETGATASAQAASTKASEATVSAQSAASSAQTATDKATLASQKASEASASASTASEAKTAAITNAQLSVAKADEARNSATAAAISATSAQEYDESAQQSAVNAQTSATNAAASEAAAKRYAEDSAAYLGAYPTDTAEGEIASFSDGADAPMKSLVVGIEPAQDLHGYDNPWPAGGGVNLLPPYSQPSVTNNGITLTNSNGEYTLNGTASSGVAVFNLSVNFPAGQYAVALNNPTANSNVQIYGVDENNAVPMQVTCSTANSATTATFELTVAIFRIRVLRYGTVDNFKLSPVFSAGATAATKFYPYSNICPITGWTGANINKSGINIWDEETELGNVSSTTGEKFNANNRIRTKNYIPVVPGAQYKIVYPMTGTIGTVAFYDSGKNFVSALFPSANAVITALSNAYYMLIGFATGYGVTYNHDISINYPATDTAYHPYSGESVDISFPTEAGTVYGGTLDVTNGVLTVDKASMTVASAGLNGMANGMQIVSATPSDKAYGVDNVISNLFATGTSGAYTVNGNTSNVRVDFRIPMAELGITESDSSSVRQDAVNEWFANHSTQLVYGITPITYSLTPIEVKSLLGQNNVWADTGDTTVEYRADTSAYIAKKIAEAISALS